MELKGQAVYVVNTFNREDIPQGYQIFASKADAIKAEKAANTKGKKYGDYAYIDTITIN